ncbi:MAG: N-6 DNA methylase [Thaumarchaeota archaeon]|nr:N-6 DNA methylase [Nitrososphaerota archaeon]
MVHSPPPPPPPPPRPPAPPPPRAAPRKRQPPQILFIERCLGFLKEGGRMGIVLPDGILGNPNYGYIRQFISQKAEILGVIDMPADTFRPSTNTKTSVLFLRKRSSPSPGRLFVCHARTCGHDKRGAPTASDEVAEIPGRLRMLRGGRAKPSRLAMLMEPGMIRNGILIPKYYNPEIGLELEGYRKAGYDIVTLGELADSGRISMENVKSLAKKDEPDEDSGQPGDVPFIRTSDIGNLEVMVDPPHCVGAEAYERIKERQGLRDGDILMVKDGTFLIGKTAMVTDLDTRVVVQGHFYRIRAKRGSDTPPHFLLGALNIEIVQREIESKSFTQSSITTLGSRWREVRIPIPKDPSEVGRIDALVQASVREQRDAKRRLASVRYGREAECLMGMKNRAALGNS